MQNNNPVSWIIALALMLAGVAAHAEEADDPLCPDIKNLSAKPAAMQSNVQADIERLNLCIQRAKLLQELDAITQKREEALRDAQNGKSIGGYLGGPVIPPLPASALPSLKEKKSPVSKETLPSEAPLEMEPISTEIDAGSWKVRKIWGQGESMRAQLSDGHGTLLNVVKGDQLPNGAAIANLSVKGVAISQNGKMTDLEWEQASASGLDNNAVQNTP